MPTEYTDMLDKDEDMTTAQWIMKGLARAFGVCIVLKEEPMGLSEEEIMKRIKSYDDSSVKYHREELKKVEKKLVSYVSMTMPQWKQDMEKKNVEIEASNKRSVADASRIKQRHDLVRFDLNRLLMKQDLSEMTRNILNYGINQLDTVENYDCKPYISKINTDLETYKTNKLSSLTRDISYHIKERIKAEKRGKERLEGYLLLRKEVLGDG